jgi:serine phosphatase RsbU (regulator of sigma subunit)
VQVLLEAIARVSEARDLESLLTDIVDSSIELTGAERGLLVLRGSKDGDHNVRVARMRGKKPVSGDLRYSTTVASRVLAEARPLRAQVHSESEALELGRSVYDLKLRAVMCVPLSQPGQGEVGAPTKGVLYVDSRAATRQFSQADLALFAALAQHISIAMTNAQLQLDSLEKVRLEQSLELARAIQLDLMPRVPSIPGWDLAGWYGPAEQTGADFYDFLKVGKTSLALVVGDVTGHGIGPALITASAQGSLRTSFRLSSDPGQVVSLLNQDLCERIEDGRFLTLFLATIDEHGTVHALNAGHSEPLLWRAADRSIQPIQLTGPALGMIADEAYRAHPPFAMRTGDVLVAYTDGLTEARTPGTEDDFFGEDGLKRVLDEGAAAGLSARDLCARMAEASLAKSGGKREDDITIVVARRS